MKRETSGNCNTSTTTVLSKAGVPFSQICQISSRIPGIKTGVGTIRPWTEKEQKAAIQRKDNRRKFDEENRFRKPWLR